MYGYVDMIIIIIIIICRVYTRGGGRNSRTGQAERKVEWIAGDEGHTGRKIFRYRNDSVVLSLGRISAYALSTKSS